MIRKGIISNVPGATARITFLDLDQSVSYELPICPHVLDLHVGDMVVVAFWGTSLADGAVIGKVV
ncbi:MAG: hypothetical protein QHH06_10285 [Clostridiales bacterium]|jgi:hypothetical protein|nr:hypothetical protein [Eubacteriales bacterium]MDH7566853.1 hypothetical protein [Clostridiales bacterium]